MVRLCREEEMPWYIIGNGSNLLVSDRGYRGVVIQLYRDFGDIRTEGTSIFARAGASLARIAAEALKNSLTGFEFAAGIPGTLGRRLYHERGCLRRRDEGCPGAGHCP